MLFSAREKRIRRVEFETVRQIWQRLVRAREPSPGIGAVPAGKSTQLRSRPKRWLMEGALDNDVVPDVLPLHDREPRARRLSLGSHMRKFFTSTQ